MSKEHGFGKFLTGALIGAGLGVLLAPKKGSETRKELKEKMDELVKEIKEIDYGEVKTHLLNKVNELKEELKDLDREKALAVAKAKASQIKDKAEELLEVAKEKGTPMVEKAAKEMKEKTVEVLKEVLAKLEEEREEPVKLKPKKVAAKK